MALEPDPSNALILRRRFRFRKQITIVEAAVGLQSGKAMMMVGGGAWSTLAKKQREIIEANPEISNLKSEQLYNVEVDVISLMDLIIRYGYPDYIKVDVEGFEEMVIKSLAKPVALISFEANLPDYEDETIACINHLSALAKNSRFNLTVTEPPQIF